MSTKIHQLVDGRGRPLVVALTPGQAGDSPMLKPLLSHLVVNRLGPGRPRTRPAAVIGDKAYSSRAIRAELRSRGVRAVIPQPSDQIAHRRRVSRWPAACLRPGDLQGSQRHRTVLQRTQAVAGTGHPLRQARRRLPGRGRASRHHHLASRIRRHVLGAGSQSSVACDLPPTSPAGNLGGQTRVRQPAGVALVARGADRASRRDCTGQPRPA